MNDLDLCYLPGHAAIEKFKTGKLSPRDILNAQIARAGATNPAVNAFTDTYHDEAMAQARAAEVVYAKNPDQARPLEGLTLAVKDSQALAGKRSSLGSLIYQNNVATNTSS